MERETGVNVTGGKGRWRRDGVQGHQGPPLRSPLSSSGTQMPQGQGGGRCLRLGRQQELQAVPKVIHTTFPSLHTSDATFNLNISS